MDIYLVKDYYLKECMKCCESAVVTEHFSATLDSLRDFPRFQLLCELIAATLSHYHYIYSL